MARFIPVRLLFRKILIVAACLAVSWCVRVPVVSAQHPGHVGGGVRIYTPPRRFVLAGPRAGAMWSGAWLNRGPYGPFRFRPVFPVYGSPFYFGPYSWIWGSWGYGGCWWTNYYPCAGWGVGYNPLPLYAPGPVPAPVYQYYGQQRVDFPELFLKDGTVYSVSDYWLVDDQLHFTTKEPGRRGSAEHVIDINELDVETTIDENTARGFRFVLRHEPLQQYMRDYPDQVPPDWPRPKE